MSALDELAERCGIEAEFIDARGSARRTSDATRRALLAAIGIRAGDEDSARAALAELTRNDWTSPLAPVYVLYSSGPFAIHVSLPRGSAEVSWRVTLEDGTLRTGRSRYGDLPLLGSHDAGDIRYERRQLALDDDLPFGYHELFVEPGAARSLLIVTPGECWVPPVIERGSRVWGVAAQVYLLRSARNWGMGDFSDLRRLVETLAPLGADVIGLNPLHSLFMDDPEHASPYSPASRLLLNVWNIDVAALVETSNSAEARHLIASAPFQRTLATCRDAHLLDYSGVARLKLPVLRLLFETNAADPSSAQWQAFAAFRQAQGEILERGCLFEALRHHFAAQASGCADWRAWPAEYQNPHSAAVERFAAESAQLLTFHAWLQFVADEQLRAAAAAAKSMAVGLYRDLAVGADPAGAETWVNQSAVVGDAHVGAPPDIYNPAGQDWGLPPFDPGALRRERYQSFVELVRANMRHAGGLRIDHVMGLRQLYWVPTGSSPAEGAYVRYPLDDLIGILALESVRNRCLVVGEDLGTVPAGFRERMAAARIFSYRVLFFEKDESGFIPPERYPRLAVAVTGSHDLPTLQAWWQSSDLELKERLGLYPSDADAQRARQERRTDRNELLQALERAGLREHDAAMTPDELIAVAHTYLARSRSALAMAQLDDIAGEAEPVNVPTTSDEHPNWRRRLSLSIEQLAEHPRLTSVAAILQHERANDARNASNQ